MYNILSDTKITGRILVHATRFPAGSLLFADAVDASSTELKYSLLSQSNSSTIVPVTGAGTGVLGTTLIPFGGVVTNLLTLKAASHGASAPSHVAVFTGTPLPAVEPLKAMSWTEFKALLPAGDITGSGNGTGLAYFTGSGAGQKTIASASASWTGTTFQFTAPIQMTGTGAIGISILSTLGEFYMRDTRLPPIDGAPLSTAGDYILRSNGGTGASRLSWAIASTGGGSGTVTGTGSENRLARWTATSSQLTDIANSISTSNFLRSGSGTTMAPFFSAIAFADLTTGTLGTGTADGTKFLNGLREWVVPPTGGGTITGSGTVNTLAFWSTTTTNLGYIAAGTGVLKAGSPPAFSALLAADISNAALGSGTANNTTFLRGDRTWATPAGGGTVGGSGTSGSLAKWLSGGTSIGNSILSESGSDITVAGSVTVAGNLTAGNYLIAPLLDVSDAFVYRTVGNLQMALPKFPHDTSNRMWALNGNGAGAFQWTEITGGGGSFPALPTPVTDNTVWVMVKLPDASGGWKWMQLVGENVWL